MALAFQPPGEGASGGVCRCSLAPTPRLPEAGVMVAIFAILLILSLVAIDAGLQWRRRRRERRASAQAPPVAGGV